jgi:predicted peptidase
MKLFDGCLLLVLGLLVLVSPAEAQTNVRAWHAKGQTWVVWDAGASPNYAYSVFRSANAFTSTAQATLVGTPLNREYNASRLKLANTSATWRVPIPGGGTYQLTATEGLFVHTPHAAASEFFAVVPYGTTSVTAGMITTGAVAQGYDPVNDPVQCHVQLQGTLPVQGQGSYPYTVYSMWVDGRDDVNDARPDFPVLANAPKHGAPHLFAIYEPSSLTGLPATPFPATLQLHGGGSWGHYWGWRPSYTYYANTGHLPVGGINIAHDDRVYRAAQGAVSEDSPSYWFGWYSTMPAINPVGQPPDNAVVVPYTLRRLIWIQDWIEQRSTYAGRVDAKRVSVMGTSMGGFGTHLLCRYKPERFSAGSAFVPVMGNPDTGASIKWLGTSTQNLATVDLRNGVPLRVNDFFSPMVQLSPLRDRTLTRFYRGRQEVDNALTKYGWEDSDIPGQYRALNDLGIGMHLYWDNRDHGPTGWATDEATPPEVDIGEWVAPVRTERSDASYQGKFRADQSYPGIFNDDQDAVTADRQPDIGNGTHNDGAPWGTWSGYHDWDTTTITDTPLTWACTMFLVGQSTRSVDNYPGTTSTCDVSVRKPQQFKPGTGTPFTWEWRDVSGNTLVQSGSAVVGADDVVTVTGLQMTKDPNRRRLTITAQSGDTAPSITSTAPVSATVGQIYSYTIVANGSPAPTLMANGLPAWLSLSGNVLSGTPPTAGTFGPITLTAGNGIPPAATQTFSITANVSLMAPVITSTPATNAFVGQPFSYTITTTGSPAPTLSMSGLPAWLSLSGNVLSGTPPSAGTTGTITLTASNGVNPDATQSFVINVSTLMPPGITSSSVTTAAVGQPYSYAITTTGNPAPSLSTVDDLPEWLSFTGNVLSGTPTQSGSLAVTLVADNGVNPPATQSFTLNIGTAPAITSAPIIAATVGQPYSYTIATTGTPAPVLSASGLPAWLSLSGSVLSGTPTAAGATGTITLTASNGYGTNATQSFTITTSAASTNDPTNVRAWSANGQTFIVWKIGATDPLSYDVYRSATPFTDISQATLAGRLFKPEWQGDRLKIASSTLTWRVPNGSGGTYQLAANEGLFVFTQHSAANEYFAVVRNGSSAVTAANMTITAIAETYDPVNDRVRCHLQFTGATTRSYPYSVYAVWADGRDDSTDARPDFPILANAAKNGAPHVFGVYEPLGGLPANGTYPAVLCFHGGGSSGQWNIWAPESGVTANCGNQLTQGIVVAHDDRVFMVNSGGTVDTSLPSFWLGWSPSMNPFAVANLNVSSQPVVPYTQRRVMWIQDWLEQRSPYRIDTSRVSLMGNSMGGAGSCMLARRYPERFAAATCYVPPIGFAENTGFARRVIGTSTQNLPSVDPSPAGGVLRISDYWNFATRLSVTQRDVPFMRMYRGRSEYVTSTTVPEWSASTVIATYEALNATAWGVHLFWDQRDHSPSDWSTEDLANPYPDIGQWISPVLTARPARTSITRYLRNQSFPAFFNDDQNASLTGRQPSMGNGDPLDGDLWGTWSGYYDWDQSTISDTTNYWATTLFLTGQSSFSVDNYPGTSSTASIGIRRPQSFLPSAGASLSWRLRRLSDGVLLQSGTTTAPSDGLVSINGLTLFKDPVRTRLEVYPTAQPPTLGLGNDPQTVATTLAQLSSLTVPTTGPNANQPLLTVNGTSGLSLVVEYSDDLVTWLPITTTILTGTSTVYADTTFPRPAKRFYRLRLP